jgi:hypothetical protein
MRREKRKGHPVSQNATCFSETHSLFL